MVFSQGGSRRNTFDGEPHRMTHEDMIEGSGSTVTGSESFLYDGLGNRRILNASTNLLVGDQTFDFTIQDQIHDSYGYTNDASGNTIASPGGVIDTYDTENRLVKRVV